MSRKDLRQPQSAQMQSSARVAFGNPLSGEGRASARPLPFFQETDK